MTTTVTPDSLKIDRCPHCGTARPFVARRLQLQTDERDLARFWHLFTCNVCGGAILLSAPAGSLEPILEIYPAVAELSDSIPARPKEFLRQARQALETPVGAIVTAASAVDAMLKANGLTEGSLYARIDKAVEGSLITESMGTWAHQVRLDANDQRHADENAPFPTLEDARLCVDFAVALAEFMFVWPARVTRGIQASSTQGDG